MFLFRCLSSLCNHVPWLCCTRFPNHTCDLIWIAAGSNRATYLIRAAEIFKSWSINWARVLDIWLWAEWLIWCSVQSADWTIRESGVDSRQIRRFYSTPRHLSETDSGAQQSTSLVGIRFVSRGYSGPTGNWTLMDRGRGVCVASRLRPGDRIVNPCRRYPNPSGRAWGQPIFFFSGYRVSFPRVKGLKRDDDSPPSSAVV